jgi:hypothetical protein
LRANLTVSPFRPCIIERRYRGASAPQVPGSLNRRLWSSIWLSRGWLRRGRCRPNRARRDIDAGDHPLVTSLSGYPLRIRMRALLALSLGDGFVMRHESKIQPPAALTTCIIERRSAAASAWRHRVHRNT